MKQPHIQLDESVTARCALMPGDPKRVDVIASCLEDVEELTFNREYRSIIGTYKNMRVIGISTGMGGSSVAIAIEELKNIGVDTMMRIGSAGALQEGIDLGDLVICEAAVRDEGTSKAYIDPIYPAVPDYRLINHCVEAAKDFGYEHHVGIVLSHESFYYDEDAIDSQKWSKKGVLASDFETAALYTVGRLRKVHTASILNNVVLWGENTEDSIGSYAQGAEKTARGEKREILTALEAMYRLQKELNQM
ncbi:MAG: nucleoside phosphorylase [Erysipelotrichaceae bacterium]|nr:nucleoside phosphorylase [Erysipelotrichaceae bacterium]